MARDSIREKKLKSSYGIAEWYGLLFRKMSESDRMRNLKPIVIPDCPYLLQSPKLAPVTGTKCAKSGGVCSIRNFTNSAKESGDISFGKITATCPNRFLENKTIVEFIGTLLLGNSEPVVVKEVTFLKRNNYSSKKNEDDEGTKLDGREDVGKIDLVFINPDKLPLEWCAVEMQAVYFSGGSMSKDFAKISEYRGNSIPMPGAMRRPDFRSSGPKRLMPQLQIKVPTLRRWGKKMVVVIDKSFLDAMSPMPEVNHVSNCDIVWLVVDFIEDHDLLRASLQIDRVLYTTLEDSVIGLTAGTPSTLPEFEKRLKTKLEQNSVD